LVILPGVQCRLSTVRNGTGTAGPDGTNVICCPKDRQMQSRQTNGVDPTNPALSQYRAVVVCNGDDYFGELPCSDADEVQRFCTLLTEFVASTKLGQ